MAGIHGRESEGSYSIVLSGGYEDDEDNGDEFTYSGSGGRDLSGNKRTAKQSYDQKLTHMNRYRHTHNEGGQGQDVRASDASSSRALAKNCSASIDDKKGATAKNWREGKPVRVVSSHVTSVTYHMISRAGM